MWWSSTQVAALTRKPNIEGEMGDQAHGSASASHVPGAAQADRNIKRSNTIVIFINQIRMKIGVNVRRIPRRSTGGNALKFYSSLCAWISGASGRSRMGEEVVGSIDSRQGSSRIKWRLRSCETEFEIMIRPSGAFPRRASSLNMGVLHNMVGKIAALGTATRKRADRAGAKDNARTLAMQQHPEIAKDIEAARVSRQV